MVDGVEAKRTHGSGKLTLTPRNTIADGAEFSVLVRYSGAPRPVRSPWGEIGWEELEDGVVPEPAPATEAKPRTTRTAARKPRPGAREDADEQPTEADAAAPAADVDDPLRLTPEELAELEAEAQS